MKIVATKPLLHFNSPAALLVGISYAMTERYATPAGQTHSRFAAESDV